MFPAQNAGVRWASLGQAPPQQVATILLLRQQGEDVLALRRDAKPRPSEAFMLLKPWGKQAASFPEQSTLMWLQGVHPLGLVGLYELGGLFQPKCFESVVLSLQSGVRHKQAFLLTELLHFSPPPCDLAKHSQFCLSQGMTAGPQSPAAAEGLGFTAPCCSPAQLPDMSSLGSQRGSAWRV